MKKVIIILALLFICFSVFTDIPDDIAHKYYYPTFLEWVILYLEANISTVSDDYAILTTFDIINDKYRFIINCYYDYNVSNVDRFITNELIPKMKGIIESQCQLWSSRGYTISLNDFIFEINPVY